MFATIVTFWPKGYADEDGLTMVGFRGTLSPAAARDAVARIGYPVAKIWGTQHNCTHDVPFPRETFSEDYRREMSRADNS